MNLQHGNPTKFGSGLISAQSIRNSAESGRVTVGPVSEHKQASLKVKKNGETVESIEVTCSCGEKIIIALNYTH